MPLLGFGVAGIAGALEDAQPALGLLAAVAGLGLATLWLARDRPRATALGQRLLEAERGGRTTLGHVPTHAEIPMAIAVYGAGAMWVADPGIASAWTVAREQGWTPSSFGGGGANGGCGASGVSCGGGGGGCGGGGCGGGG